MAPAAESNDTETAADMPPWPRVRALALRLVLPFAVNVAAIVVLDAIRRAPPESGAAWIGSWGAMMIALALLPFSGVIWPLLAVTHLAATHARGRASVAWNIGLFAAAALANAGIWVLGCRVGPLLDL